MSVSKEEFGKLLLNWAQALERPMPWRGEKNPYLVWLSEIILQQTRVEQGMSYYLKFKAAFPRVKDLAAAPADEVMKLWQGLGYYSRARNLQAAAKYIMEKHQGVFPSSYQEIIQLKGVGPYTAAAIASLAFNQPYAVVDGNVFRVLSRIFGIKTPIDSTKGKKEFTAIAQALLDEHRPGEYNQAMMDFGATVCLPKKPKCRNCPFQSHCFAFKENAVQELPFKEKKIVRKDRFFQYLIFQSEAKTLLQKRMKKDIWKNLYQFPLIESAGPDISLKNLSDQDFFNQLINGQQYELIGRSPIFRQTLTHQNIIATFWSFELTDVTPLSEESLRWVERSKLSEFAFPKIIDCFLSDNSLTLNLF